MFHSRSTFATALILSLGTALALLFESGEAHATGPTCDIGSGPAACIAAIQGSGAGRVVNDIFRDAKGRDAMQLPVYGTLVPIDKIFPACTVPPTQGAPSAGCNPGVSNPPYDCPGGYTCAPPGAITFASVSAAVNGKPDRKWGHPCRLSDHTLTAGCPNYASCVADGAAGGYNPWEGLVFDLGGPSNQVAIFADNDHGPQPCESVEYTVFLTNDPKARDIVLAPTTTGADPSKWNRAVLKKIYTKGWADIRPTDPTKAATCGDTPDYAVEEDSMVPIYAMPCGINFRYAAIVAGNDGLDFPSCAFNSIEAELDSVAGLTETGDAVCPDKDGDSFVDCTCAGAPKVCDCDDNDPLTHPNAPEACNSTKDLNCNGVTPEACPPGRGCAAGVCVPFCGGELGCPPGSTCQPVGASALCVPNDCTVGGCPPGATCDATSKKCVPNCDVGVVCPTGQKCVAGACLDPCRDVKCAAGFTCKDGVCNPPCSCFAGDVGCTGTNKCDRPADGGAATNQCVTPDCLGVSCAAGQHCTAGKCLGFCDGVKCPPGEVCIPPATTDAGADAGATSYGCVNLCAGISCVAPDKCDPATGKCVAPPSPDGGGLQPTPPPDGAGGADGGAFDDSFGAPSDETSGCACTTAGFARMSATTVAVGALLGVMLVLRRRRRRH